MKATPESASAALNAIVTSVLLQPFAFGGGVNVALRSGGVLSMLMPATTAEAELPAKSWQLPATCWWAPSEESTIGAGGEPGAKPDKRSVQAKLTVTSLLFQLLAFAA